MYYEQLNKESDKQVEKLIESEAKKCENQSFEKYNKKVASSNQQKSIVETITKISCQNLARGNFSRKNRKNRESKMMEDNFVGPCVLCLEPDEESEELFMELTDSLRKDL